MEVVALSITGMAEAGFGPQAPQMVLHTRRGNLLPEEVLPPEETLFFFFFE